MKKVAVFLLSFLLLFSGIFIGTYNNSDTPYLPTFIDPCDGTVVIENEDVPLANVTSKTTTKTSKKKSTKQVKMKKASKKTYTKKLPAKVKTTTKTSTNDGVTTKVVTTTTTVQTEKYKKNSKIKKVISTVTTKVVTTTVTTGSGQEHKGATKVATSGGEVVKKDNLNVRAMAPLMDGRVLSAFETLGFKVSVDSTVNYSGNFNASAQQITLKSETDPCIYHELGHFLGFLANNVDRSTEFQTIYAAEKDAYTAYNKAYATQNASEYFAESVKDYFLDNANLQSARPQTYTVIVSALNMVTDNQIAQYKQIYSSVWTF